jgi:hypothetical protein
MYYHWILAALQRANSITAAAVSMKPLLQPIPVIYLCLTPNLQIENASLDGQLSAQVVPIVGGSRFMSMPFTFGNMSLSNYSSLNPIRVYNELGSLPIWYEDKYDLDQPSRI